MIQECEETGTNISTNEDENIYINIKPNTPFSNIVQNWYIPDDPQVDCDIPPSEDHKPSWTKSEILKNTRKFNFDLSPKVLT